MEEGRTLKALFDNVKDPCSEWGQVKEKMFEFIKFEFKINEKRNIFFLVFSKVKKRRVTKVNKSARKIKYNIMC